MTLAELNAIVLVVVIVAIIFLWKKGGMKIPSIPTGWMVPGAGVWSWLWRVFENTKEELAIVAALGFLTLVLYRVGYANWDLLYYLPGIFVLSWVTKWVVKGRRFVPLTVAIVAFLILGFSHPWPPDPTKTTWAGVKEWWNKEPSKVAVAPSASRVTATPVCLGTPEYPDLDSSEQVVNRNLCQLRWWVNSGCVQFYTKSGAKLGLPVCANEKRVIPGIYAARATTGTAKFVKTECPPGTPGTLLESCG